MTKSEVTLTLTMGLHPYCKSRAKQSRDNAGANFLRYSNTQYGGLRGHVYISRNI